MLEAGLAQVGVDIDEAGADDKARGVDRFTGFLASARSDRRHASVDDKHVGNGVQTVNGIDDATTTDGERFAHGFPLASR